MVYIVLIALITLALLALLVLGLHRYQLSIAQTNADKHNPLPPLDNISLGQELPDLTLNEDVALSDGRTSLPGLPSTPGLTDLEESPENGTATNLDANLQPDLESLTSRGAESASQKMTRTSKQSKFSSDLAPVAVNDSNDEPHDEEDTEIIAPDSTYQNEQRPSGVRIAENSHHSNADQDGEAQSAGSPAKTFPRTSDNTAYQNVTDETAASDSDTDGSGSWQERVAELKKQDRLDEAIEVCRQEYPLWSAYQQASLIHRARIKHLAQKELDITAELQALYQLAAQASFLHDRVKGLPNLSLAQLKLLDLSPVSQLEMPYSQIGYSELRLIKKTDIKLMLDKWGRPESHMRPREVHADAWRSLCGNTQSTLF